MSLLYFRNVRRGIIMTKRYLETQENINRILINETDLVGKTIFHLHVQSAECLKFLLKTFDKVSLYNTVEPLLMNTLSIRILILFRQIGILTFYSNARRFYFLKIPVVKRLIPKSRISLLGLWIPLP